MKKQVKNNVFWVGKNDWGVRNFHGFQYSTKKGSTYNSYLIKEEKTVLIDTVFTQFALEYINELTKEINLSSIDYIIINHAEPDHSGALPELMSIIPEVPIYCTENGIKSIKGHYHKDWNFKPIKTGNRLSIGNDKELIFIQTPLLHWPDSMFCYLTGDNILFSSDAFGQHYCSEFLYNDLVDQNELFHESIKYYANILTPYSHLVTKKIEELLELKLPIDIICTSHGVIWRDNPFQIIRKYAEWAINYQEDQITVIFDTMHNGTSSIAENIVKGINLADDNINVKLYHSAVSDRSDLLTEIFKSKAILIGSPTVNNGIMHSIAGLLESIKGLKFKNKKAATFGCYGWNDIATKEIAVKLKESGFEIIMEPISSNWEPSLELLNKSMEYGKELVTKLKREKQSIK